MRHAPYGRLTIRAYGIVYRFDAETVYVARFGKQNDDEVYRWSKR